MKHDDVSKSLLKEGMLAYHITAAITSCIVLIEMAIPLTRANRLAAMRESTERITSVFHTLPARLPAFYVCPSTYPGFLDIEVEGIIMGMQECYLYLTM